jgi:hypothetical protein
MSIPVAFNNQLDKFLDELIQTYPEDKDFAYYKRLIDNVKRFNIRKPIELFASVIQNHTKLIQDRDSDFFFNNFNSIVNNEITNANNQAEAFRLFDNIKKYWSEMPEENKKVIWDYLNVLMKLSMSHLLSTMNTSK